MRQIRHPLSGALYDATADGNILVTTNDGASGLFRHDGTWIEGGLRHADPHLCQWVVRPNLMSRHKPVLNPEEAHT